MNLAHCFDVSTEIVRGFSKFGLELEICDAQASDAAMT
jgi:hypothetical protein